MSSLRRFPTRFLSYLPQYGTSALLFAAEVGHAGIVETLIEAGISINHANMVSLNSMIL